MIKRILAYVIIMVLWVFIVNIASFAQSSKATHIVYDVYSRGMHVITIEANYTLAPDKYKIDAHFNTSGVVSLFVGFNMFSSVNGVLQNHHAVPQLFESSGKTKGKKFKTVIDYYNNQKVEVKTLIPERESNRDLVTEEQSKNSVDLLSAVLDLIYQVRSDHKCEDNIKIFDGLKIFNLQSQTIGEALVPSNWTSPYKGKSILCKAVIQQTGGLKQSRHRALMAQPQLGFLWFQSIDEIGFLPIRFELQHPKMGKVIVILRKIKTNN